MLEVYCETCNKQLSIGDWPWCPHDRNSTAMINGDDIPGGLDVRHGICWPDGTPRRFYSKSEIKRAAFEAGLFIVGDTPKVNPRLEEVKQRERESK